MKYLGKAFFNGIEIVFIEEINKFGNFELYQCTSIQRETTGYVIYNNSLAEYLLPHWIDKSTSIDPTIALKIKKLLHYHNVACSAIIKGVNRVSKSRQFVITEYGTLVLVGLNTITISDTGLTVAPGLEDYYYYASVPAIGNRCILRKDYNKILRKSKELIAEIDRDIWKKLTT